MYGVPEPGFNSEKPPDPQIPMDPLCLGKPIGLFFFFSFFLLFPLLSPVETSVEAVVS